MILQNVLKFLLSLVGFGSEEIVSSSVISVSIVLVASGVDRQVFDGAQ